MAWESWLQHQNLGPLTGVTHTENRFVTGQLIPQPPNKVWFWIGANRTSDYVNDWVWTDGSPFDYEKFCPPRLKSSNYDCLDVGTNMNYPQCRRETWHNQPCGLPLSSVCKLRESTQKTEWFLIFYNSSFYQQFIALFSLKWEKVCFEMWTLLMWIISIRYWS